MKHIMLILLVFAQISCGNTKRTSNEKSQLETKQTETLSGTYTISMLHNYKGFEIEPDLTITFDETSKTVSGFSGCNRFNGTYSVAGKSIKFTPLAATRMICKRFMDIEHIMLKSINNTDGFSITENNTLTFSQGGKPVLKAQKKIISKAIDLSLFAIEYTAKTRGSSLKISIKDNIISFQNNTNTEATTRTYSDLEKKTLTDKLSPIDLNRLQSLDAPTEARFRDAALIATLKITNDGKTYETPSFDHGEPNAYIKDLVNTIIAMSEKQ